MGAVNSSWHRWIYASVAKHIKSAAATASLAMVVEFLDKRTPAWEAADNRAEALITGPATKEISKGLHRVWVDVFITLTSVRGANDYAHIGYAGAMANALDQCILVKDYGTTGLVNVGSLKPRTETSQTINVQHLQPGEKDETIHSTIQARYMGLFSE